jgi:hypothetical protein
MLASGDMMDLRNVLSVVAITLSIVALFVSNRLRLTDTFAKLYDESNSAAFGEAMELVARWAENVRLQVQKESVGESDIRAAYRAHLTQVAKFDGNTKLNEVERSRRMLKVWFIKCLLLRNSRDLKRRDFRALIHPDRARLMWTVFYMTREQADFMKGKRHDPESRTAFDERYFAQFARILGHGR